jgi:hypothetical protein
MGMEANGDRLRYFVLTYDSAAMRVLSLSGHGRDFTGAVLTLSSLEPELGGRSVVVVLLLVGGVLPDLLTRLAELLDRLTFHDA